ncbi:hypothetical protein C0993_003820, partial [Termitomyces sp. T159_Od127]
NAHWPVAKELEALACEEMGLGEATGAGKGSGKENKRKESAKKKVPENLTGAALEVAAPATSKAPTGAQGEGTKVPSTNPVRVF